MKTNAGTLDHTLRIVVALALIGMAATDVVGVWGWIGVVPLLTGPMGNGPRYSLLGVNSGPTRR